jgi:hypothetical protein
MIGMLDYFGTCERHTLQNAFAGVLQDALTADANCGKGNGE